MTFATQLKFAAAALLAGAAFAQTAPNATTKSLPQGTVGNPYTATLAASGGRAPLTWSASGTLPPGLSLSSSGSISGSPTQAGSFDATFKVTDSRGQSDPTPPTITMTVIAPLNITTKQLASGSVGAAYSDSLSATGGTGGYTWTVSGGALPAGLHLSTGGAITGTPTTAGPSGFTAQVKDSSNNTDTQNLSITIVAPLTVNTSSLAAGTAGSPYSATLAASGGTAPYTWTVTALPAGLSLSGNTISGTPTSPGTTNFTAQVTDSANATASKPLSITVNAAPLQVTTASLPDGTVGKPYSATLSASGGVAPYTWSATTLPAGLSLSGNTISGTPTTPGPAAIGVTVTDSVQSRASRALSITINAPPLVINTGSLPSATVGVPYSQTLSASGGTPPYSWFIRTGALPPGLNLSGNTISGTPISTGTAAGTSNFTVEAVDSAAVTATKALSITVNPPQLQVTTASLAAGTVGTPYSATLSASGGTGGYSWSVSTGTLPAGLSLSGNTISGTPTTAGPSNFTVQVSDSSGTTATKPLSITVNPSQLQVTTTSLTTGTVGSPYSATLSASGGTGGYSWSVSSGTLPAGLTISGSTITGTPTTAGASNFTVQVTDSFGTTATKPLSITVNPSQLQVTTTSLAAGTVGSPYSATLSASGGTGGYSWSVSSGTLPAGLSISGSTISGTPTTAGGSNFTVQVSDSSGATATKPLSITVNPSQLQVTTSSLAAATVGSPYSATLSASGGTGGYSWSVSSGTLPAGLSISGSTISGTPTTAGGSNFTVQVSDSSGATATKPLSITVNPSQLQVTTTSLAAATVGSPYSATLSASGGTGGYSWSVSSGTLPAGLSISGSTISGTPTTAGSSNFTVQVSDSSGATATKPLSITVNASQLQVTTTSLASATVGSPYSATLSASGGTGGYSWSVSSGTLPAGLSISGSTISGTPTTAGSSTFTVQVSDSSGATATKQLSITANPPQVQVTTSSLAGGTTALPYSATLSATGGTGTYSWSISSGTLPAGLSLSGNTISGTPTEAGTSTFTVRAADSTGSSGSKQLSITVSAAQIQITTASLPGGSVGAAYAQTFSASGGTGAYSWSVSSGTLPPGVALSGNTLSGTPTTAGNFGFTILVTDTAGATASKQFTVTVNAAQIQITAGDLPQARTAETYSATLSATGGVQPYTWTIASGELPSGLSLSTSGNVSGTPTTTGSFTFTAQVSDAAGAHAQGPFTISVGSALRLDTAPSLPSGSAGSPYTATILAAGAVAPLQYAVTTGTLPTGLSLTATSGVISGTPTQVGSFSFAVQVKDSSGAAVSGTYNVSIASGVTIATPPVLPTATVGVPYSVTIEPAGGTNPYVWAVTAGALPAGLTFSAGKISGTPTASGDFTFTVQVTDGNTNRATKDFTLTVAGPMSITTAPILTPGTTGSPYRQTIAATGGVPPYTWSVANGSLPPGLTLDAALGTVTGTPTAAGAYGFTLMVADSAAASVQKQFTIVVSQGVTISTAAALPGATAGATYTLTLAASGGTAPYTWSVASGSLPAGIVLNATTGTLSGTPGVAGTYNFTIQVTDAAKLAATKVLTLIVALPSAPSLTISGLPASLGALQQPAIDVSMSAPYPVTITGTLTLTFNPAGPNPADDPSVQFSTGGRSVAFTIPANSTHAVFASPLALQSGSVTGTISLSVASWQAGASPFPKSDATAQSQVLPAVPTVASVSMVDTNGGFQVQIAGISTTRELTQATISFKPAAGSNLVTTQLVVPLGPGSQAWFQSAAAAAYGGQFSLTLPFTVSGGTNVVGSVSVILSNSVGDSPAGSS